MRAAQLLALPRVAICGGPRTGKTTLAAECGRQDVVHTDDFIEQMRGVRDPGPLFAASLAGQASFVLEGVRAAHALRAGLRVDGAIYISAPRAECTPGQANMAKGVQTVFDQWMLADDGKTPVLVI